jgi:hypothetical protein
MVIALLQEFLDELEIFIELEVTVLLLDHEKLFVDWRGVDRLESERVGLLLLRVLLHSCQEA